ncbi:MAG: hypothetical protein U0X86_000123 [Wolbachia endosymbiont of Xenopsylla cheopis]
MNIGSYFQQFKKLFFNLINRIKKIFTDINHQFYQQSSEPQEKVVEMQKGNESISHEKSNSSQKVSKVSDLSIESSSLPSYPLLDPDTSLQSTSNIPPYRDDVADILDLHKNAQINCRSSFLASLECSSLTSSDGVKIYSLSKPFHFDKVTTLNKIDNSYTYNVDNKLWSHHSINAASTFNQAKPAMHFQHSDYCAHNSIYYISQQVTGGNNWVFGEGESSDFTNFVTNDDSLDIYDEQDLPICDENEEECPDCIYQKKYENGACPAMRFDDNGRLIETFCNKHGQDKLEAKLGDIQILEVASQQNLVRNV